MLRGEVNEANGKAAARQQEKDTLQESLLQWGQARVRVRVQPRVGVGLMVGWA